MKNYLFVDKYRPKTIEDCILPKKLKGIFKDIVETGSLNYTLCGPAGSGKTTVARALANELGATVLLINASEENGIDMLRTKIKRYASTSSLDGSEKIVILDEADYLSHAAQPALRRLIEEFSDNCRFILTCNYKNKIIDPILSRCPLIDFNVPAKEREEIASKIFDRLKSILDEEGITYEDDVLVRVVLDNFPDFRRMIGKIQQYSKEGSLDPMVVSAHDQADYSQLFSIMKKKEFVKLRKWVSDHSDLDMQIFFSQLYDYIWKLHRENKLPITNQSVAMLMPMLAEHAYRSNFIVDTQISMMGFLSLMMVEVEFV